MIVSRERRAWSPRSAMFVPSMVMDPPAASMMRKRPSVSDDFPAPVRPTIPTFHQIKWIFFFKPNFPLRFESQYFFASVDFAGDSFEDEIEAFAVADLVVVERHLAVLRPIFRHFSLPILPWRFLILQYILILVQIRLFYWIRNYLNGFAIFFYPFHGDNVRLYFRCHAHKHVECLCYLKEIFITIK